MRLHCTAFLLPILFTLACSGSPSSSSPAQNAGEEEEAPFADEIVTKTDAAIERELAAAAAGALYISEGDFRFTTVKASLPAGTRTITTDLVRGSLASYVDEVPHADKPLASLKSMTRSFRDWETDFAECRDREGADPEQCPKIAKMNQALSRHLRGIKIFYFGRKGEDGDILGTSVSVFIVGRTPRGNLAGVRTFANWT